MMVELAFHAAGALAGAAVAVGLLVRDRRSLVHRVAAAGMIALALEAALSAAAAAAGTWPVALAWHHARLLASALLPGCWLLFSLVYARSESRLFVRQWRFALLAAFALPVVLAGPLSPWAYERIVRHADRWVLVLGRSGQAFHLVSLLAAVLVLANLERTLRASTGSMRWMIKFAVLGVGAVFAARVYTNSQALLFRSVDTSLQVIQSASLALAAAFLAVSGLRSRLRDAEVYVSKSVLYRSLTAALVGGYLLAVGVLAKAVAYLGRTQVLPAVTFVVMLALLALVALVLSDRVRQGIRDFVSRNFRRPHYDYREEWTAFTRATSTVFEMKALCAAVAGRVSATLRVPSVTVWLREEDGEGVALGASTVYSESEAAALAGAHGHALSAWMALPGPRDLAALPAPASAEWPVSGDVRYAAPISAAAGEAVGVVVLGVRPDGSELSAEDVELLKTFADQAAGNILGLRLSERLLKAKEMEAFQSLSAFFVHDLKNLASKLSLTLQNLPVHYDDPEFRRDLLATITRSVDKINQMCTRLSPLSRALELQRTASDLAPVVAAALAGLNGNLKGTVEQDLKPTRPVSFDPEQIQKVVLNLVLNASDAVRAGGRIRIATGQEGRWVYVAVSDDGCGMSPEFVARSLFQPFRTTKRQGLGIGLYHSKKIVEAHQGRIEVESAEGKGTTVRVLLPG
ncbi:MAG TPA: XrtA/PEP-CTERM system histidine kinase PrsK [Vicinamibacteria bacterium]